MKKLLLIFASSLMLISCGNKKNNEPASSADVKAPVIVSGVSTFKGTVIVDKDNPESENYYKRTDVTIDADINVENGTCDIILYQVSFSSRMPVTIDMTIPGVTYSDNNLSGNDIIPLAMGGEFPRYIIKNFTGKITRDAEGKATAFTMDMMCGSYPLYFEGTLSAAE